jgi:hypothetical protein
MNRRKKLYRYFHFSFWTLKILRKITAQNQLKKNPVFRQIILYIITCSHVYICTANYECSLERKNIWCHELVTIVCMQQTAHDNQIQISLSARLQIRTHLKIRAMAKFKIPKSSQTRKILTISILQIVSIFFICFIDIVEYTRLYTTVYTCRIKAIRVYAYSKWNV